MASSRLRTSSSLALSESDMNSQILSSLHECLARCESELKKIDEAMLIDGNYPSAFTVGNPFRINLETPAVKFTYKRDEITKSWKDILIYGNMIFIRVKEAVNHNPHMNGWWSKTLKIRKTDELLIYCHQARHAYEHGSAPIIKERGLIITNQSDKSIVVTPIDDTGNVEITIPQDGVISFVPPGFDET